MRKRKENIEDIYHLHGKGREYAGHDETGESLGGDIDTGFRHSTRYHKFFEGYTEIKRETGPGKYTIERYYTAPWIVCAEPKKRPGRIALYWVLLALSVVIAVYGACIRVSSNSSVISSAPLGVYIVVILFLSPALIRYSTLKRRMTLHEFKSSSKSLLRWSTVAAACAALSAAAGIVLDLVMRNTAALSLLRMLLMLAAAAAVAAIAGLEHRLPYTTEENDTQVPSGGFTIK